jgi:hypothetical protein
VGELNSQTEVDVAGQAQTAVVRASAGPATKTRGLVNQQAPESLFSSAKDRHLLFAAHTSDIRPNPAGLEIQNPSAASNQYPPIWFLMVHRV